MSDSSPRRVLVHGVWDLLHVGHIHHLHQASLLGDELYVSVVPDEFCTKRKPIHPEKDRLRVIMHLRDVTDAFLCNGPGPERVIRVLKPHVYVRSTEYLEMKLPEMTLLEELGVALAYTRPLPIHTSDIIARIKALS